MPQYKFSRCICITHPDQEKMVEFYQDVFGMDAKPSDHNSMELNGDPIRLFLDKDNAPATYFEFLVPDLEEAKTDLLSRGCTIVTWAVSAERITSAIPSASRSISMKIHQHSCKTIQPLSCYQC
ncbi:MAG TPA: hypothetical protein VFH43_10725 [Candidatus Kapabacteria bacterium]|nr:hypothetical protein [Candidatus Kapabacteria bacterium]